MSLPIQKIVDTSILPQAILQEVPSFGPALLINDETGVTTATFKEYTDYDSVLVDYADTTPTAIAAAAYFGNLPTSPQKLYILTYDALNTALVDDAEELATANKNLYYPIVFDLGAPASTELSWVNFADINKKVVLINLTSETDVQPGGSFETIASNARVSFWYHSTGTQPLTAAVAGIYGNSDLSAPNANTSFAFITFVALTPDTTITGALSDTLDGLNVNYYTNVGAAAITLQGRAANGEALNTLQQQDYVKAALDVELLNAIVSAAQSGQAITFDDAGFQALDSVITRTCQGFYNEGRGFLSPATIDEKFYKFGYKVTIPDPALAVPADKQAGIVKGIEIVLSTKDNVLKLTPTVQLV